MTKPIINIRCDGPILNEGTIFVKTEIRKDGTEINILFERKGLGTAKEMIKNIFIKKENISISTENWIKNMVHKEGHSINEKSFMENIKTAANASSVSSLHEFLIPLLQNEKNTKFEYEVFVEKAGSLKAGALDQDQYNELKIATKLLANDQKNFNQLTNCKSVDELINLRNTIGNLQISGQLGANEKKQNEFLDKTIDKLTLLIKAEQPESILSRVIIDPDGTEPIAAEKKEPTNYLDEKTQLKPQKLENSASLKTQNENSIITSKISIENASVEAAEIQGDYTASAKESIPKNSFMAPESVVIARGEILKKEFELFRSDVFKYQQRKKSTGDNEEKDKEIENSIYFVTKIIDIDYLISSLSKKDFTDEQEKKYREDFLYMANTVYAKLLDDIYPDLKPTFLPLANKLLGMSFQLGSLQYNHNFWNYEDVAKEN